MNDWTFTDLDFMVAWRGLDRDVLPYPIECVPTAETQDGYRDDVESAAARVEAQMSDNLYSALVALAMPDVRVQVRGFIGPNRERKVRIHAAVRQRVGVLLVQAEDDSVRMSRVGAQAVPNRVVTVLPQLRAGQGPSLRGRLAELRQAGDDDDEYFSGGSVMQSVTHSAAPGVPLKQFMTRSRMGLGHVAVLPGPAVDNRPTDDGLDFHFMDYRSDGRYLVRNDVDTVSVDPVDASGMADYLQRLVDAVRERHSRSMV